jgi:hypothetical protein
LLILPGKQPPPPLGGNVSNEEVNSNTTKRSKQSRTYNVPILMSGCCMLLTNTYPVKVLFNLSQNVYSYSEFCEFLLIWEKNDEK